MFASCCVLMDIFRNFLGYFSGNLTTKYTFQRSPYAHIKFKILKYGCHEVMCHHTQLLWFSFKFRIAWQYKTHITGCYFCSIYFSICITKVKQVKQGNGFLDVRSSDKYKNFFYVAQQHDAQLIQGSSIPDIFSSDRHSISCPYRCLAQIIFGNLSKLGRRQQ